MKPANLVLRCYAEQTDGAWQAFCLDLCLAAQGDSFDDVKHKLEQMIFDDVYDAVAGADKEHAAYLLSRRAPLKYWVKYYLYSTLIAVGAIRSRMLRLFKEPMPLVLAGHNHV